MTSATIILSSTPESHLHDLETASETTHAFVTILSAVFQEMFNSAPYPRTVKFRLGWNTISAYAEIMDEVYPHVLKATIQKTAFDRIVAGILSHRYLPKVLRRAAERICCVVIKKLARPDHYKYFEHDKSTYQRLEAVQGKLLLVYYGEGTCEHCFTERITLALDEMIACAGVVQEDTKLNNIMLADNGRIVFLDMEYVCDPVAGPKLSAARKWAI
ncbi:MAG: hypothetical protein STHCBS139747_006129 [Sporothrix thermara]